jgi:hypothetical protein
MRNEWIEESKDNIEGGDIVNGQEEDAVFESSPESRVGKAQEEKNKNILGINDADKFFPTISTPF